MPKEIIILGSTGSIGNTTLKIIRKNKKDFNVKLLSTNNNISTIYNQALEFKVKIVVIKNYKKINKKVFLKFNKKKNKNIFYL